MPQETEQQKKKPKIAQEQYADLLVDDEGKALDPSTDAYQKLWAAIEEYVMFDGNTPVSDEEEKKRLDAYRAADPAQRKEMLKDVLSSDEPKLESSVAAGSDKQAAPPPPPTTETTQATPPPPPTKSTAFDAFKALPPDDKKNILYGLRAQDDALSEALRQYGPYGAAIQGVPGAMACRSAFLNRIGAAGDNPDKACFMDRASQGYYQFLTNNIKVFDQQLKDIQLVADGSMTPEAYKKKYRTSANWNRPIEADRLLVQQMREKTMGVVSRMPGVVVDAPIPKEKMEKLVARQAEANKVYQQARVSEETYRRGVVQRFNDNVCKNKRIEWANAETYGAHQALGRSQQALSALERRKYELYVQRAGSATPREMSAEEKGIDEILAKVDAYKKLASTDTSKMTDEQRMKHQKALIDANHEVTKATTDFMKSQQAEKRHFWQKESPAVALASQINGNFRIGEVTAQSIKRRVNAEYYQDMRRMHNTLQQRTYQTRVQYMQQQGILPRPQQVQQQQQIKAQAPQVAAQVKQTGATLRQATGQVAAAQSTVQQLQIQMMQAQRALAQAEIARYQARMAYLDAQIQMAQMGMAPQMRQPQMQVQQPQMQVQQPQMQQPSASSTPIMPGTPVTPTQSTQKPVTKDNPIPPASTSSETPKSEAELQEKQVKQASATASKTPTKSDQETHDLPTQQEIEQSKQGKSQTSGSTPDQPSEPSKIVSSSVTPVEQSKTAEAAKPAEPVKKVPQAKHETDLANAYMDAQEAIEQETAKKAAKPEPKKPKKEAKDAPDKAAKQAQEKSQRPAWSKHGHAAQERAQDNVTIGNHRKKPQQQKQQAHLP